MPIVPESKIALCATSASAVAVYGTIYACYRGVPPGFACREFSDGVLQRRWVVNGKPPSLIAMNSMLALLMPTLTIRRLDEKTKAGLRMQAAKHGRSMEEEAREILRSALRVLESEQCDLAESIRRRFAPFHGVELSIPTREGIREPPTFRK